MKTNHFRLVVKPDYRLLKYVVTFSDDDLQDRTAVKKALLYGLRDAGKLPNFITDGMHLFSDVKISPDPKVLETQTRSGSQVQLTIRLVEELQPTDYHFVAFFNIVMRKILEGLDLQLVGRNYYSPKAKIDLRQHKLELWPGYETSIRQMEQDILLCVEISHKVLRTDTVLDQLKPLQRSPSFHAMAEKALLGQVVLTRYNNKTYRIEDIDWSRNPDTTFDQTWKKGETKTISYRQFYEEKYDKKISDPRQPLLVAKPTMKERRAGAEGPVFLVPELCHMTGLSEEQRANFPLMKDLAQYTRQDPKTRQQGLQRFSRSVCSNPKITEMLTGNNLRFNQELVQLRARQLKPELILGGGTKTFNYKKENADWSGAFRDWKQWSVVHVTKMAVFYGSKDKVPITEFINSFLKVSPSIGMKCSKPRMYELSNSNPASYVQNLEQVIKDGAQIVMVVIPSNKGDHYAAVKKTCCLTNSIPSQCITSTVLNKPKGLMSVATKVAIQVSCKLGGAPWAVKIPLKKAMVIGYDTYHDTVNRAKSVGALVASLDDNFTKFTSSCDFHDPNMEISNNIASSISKALRKYQEHNNGSLPDRIFMYRDGVGDGQIPYVKQHEVEAIEKVFEQAGMKDVKFAFIIVSKRIKTKFFRGDENPHSGTIVDDVVTLPERYDFFIVSQSVRQGTVNPTSYNVIKDTSGLTPEKMQMLTYKLTHLYYNWPGTVRVPAVCQYAHKLAFLVGETLHKTPQGGLDDLLYYL